jgi:hypothetical protein
MSFPQSHKEKTQSHKEKTTSRGVAETQNSCRMENPEGLPAAGRDLIFFTPDEIGGECVMKTGTPEGFNKIK